MMEYWELDSPNVCRPDPSIAVSSGMLELGIPCTNVLSSGRSLRIPSSFLRGRGRPSIWADAQSVWPSFFETDQASYLTREAEEILDTSRITDEAILSELVSADLGGQPDPILRQQIRCTVVKRSVGKPSPFEPDEGLEYLVYNDEF